MVNLQFDDIYYQPHRGFGITLMLRKVKRKKVFGKQVYDFDISTLHREALSYVSQKSDPLTQEEILFLSRSLEMSLEELYYELHISDENITAQQLSSEYDCNLPAEAEMALRNYIVYKFNLDRRSWEKQPHIDCSSF